MNMYFLNFILVTTTVGDPDTATADHLRRIIGGAVMIGQDPAVTHPVSNTFFFFLKRYIGLQEHKGR